MLLKKRYARLSERYPFTTAGLTSSVVFLCSDCFAQCVLTSDAVDHGFDYRRCGGLVMFGLVYYGGPLKAMYLLFDKYLGPGRAVRKAVLDVAVHTPLLGIPSFYLITGTVKGMTPEQIWEQLKAEWPKATTGSVAFWFPVCLLNFAYVPQQFRVLLTAFASFVHKSWLSWLSSRKSYAKVPLQ